MPTPSQQASAVLRLRVAIVGSDPEIWRQLDVDAGLSLTDLHDVLQIAFGWRDSHLHSFTDHNPFTPHRELPRIGGPARIWAPDDPYADDEEGLPESEWTPAESPATSRSSVFSPTRRVCGQRRGRCANPA